MPIIQPDQADALAALARVQQAVTARHLSGCGTCQTSGRILNPNTSEVERCSACKGEGVR